MLADRALALMPICASCQSKRREVLLRAKPFDFRERSALACGLVLERIVSWASRLSLSTHTLSTPAQASGAAYRVRPIFPPLLKSEGFQIGGHYEKPRPGIWRLWRIWSL